MLAFICHNPELIYLLREETKSAFKGGRRPDISYLNEYCPNLRGVWLETLLLTAFSASVRYVTKDTDINGFMLRKGGRVMIPYQQLHSNEEVFGDAVERFNPRRFVDNPKLDRNSTWRPFGGSETMCPGRHVAKHAVLSFVAMVLQRFDVELAHSQPMPRADDSKPVVGMVPPMEGDDVIVRLASRGA